ncbi:Carbohydrate esterase, partial [Globisporangium splendens]
MHVASSLSNASLRKPKSRLLALLWRIFMLTHARRVGAAAVARARRMPWWLLTSATGGSLVLHYLGRNLCASPWEIAHLTTNVAYTIVKTVLAYIARGYKPLYPEWTLSFEVTRAVMRCSSELYGHRMAVETYAKRVRNVSALFGTSLGLFYSRYHNTRVEPVVVNGLEHLWIKPATEKNDDDNSSDKRFVVVFYHGGGYATLSPRLYIPFCNTFRWSIRDKLRASHGVEDPEVDFFLANYRKIPEHPFPIPAQDAVAMYEYVVEQCNVPPSRIIIAGDSAGGGLTMSTLLRLRDSKLSEHMPLAAILICPMANLLKAKDFVPPPHCVVSASLIDSCIAALHKTVHDPTTWLDASPVHCDLRGLSPVQVHTASLDYLHSHSQDLFEKAQRDGVTDWELDVQQDMPHVFTVFPTLMLPQAMVGIQSMAAFAAKHFHRATVESSTLRKTSTKHGCEACVNVPAA